MKFNCRTIGCNNQGEARDEKEILLLKKLCSTCRRQSLRREDPIGKLNKKNNSTKKRNIKWG